ncbi:hypothetical protein ACSBR2_041603 [Camellia fascicularis]
MKETSKETIRGFDGANSWYMPSTWDDLKMFLEKFNKSSDYDIGDIRKLTVETTTQVNKRVSHVVSHLSICQKDTTSTSISG